MNSTMQPLIILNLVGLSPRLLGEFTPQLRRFAKEGTLQPLQTVIPAVTCSVQASILTGLTPSEHGIVGNGWYAKDIAEINFWRQSNRLIQGEKIWETAKKRDPKFTCANLCWWYNMASSHDIGLTPRPIYKADGRKLPDCYTKPASWRESLTRDLGNFPLFQFWGPGTSIASSRWIAEAAKHAIREFDPTLSLVYLPHLDYDLQRYGPDLQHPAVQQSLKDIDAVAGDLIRHAQAAGRRVLVLSEYGITPVDRAIHINRHLREAGYLAVRTEDGAEQLDPIASDAFAVADHQIAHVYVADPELIEPIRQLLLAIPGVESVWAGNERADISLEHERAGDLIVMSDERSWFSYYYWLDDLLAPDFARTVEIHRKPGYDPAELFVAPHISYPKLAIATRLLKRKFGLRSLMNVIGLDASLVKGSHGRPTNDPLDGPLIIGEKTLALPLNISVTDVKDIVLDLIFEPASMPRTNESIPSSEQWQS
ncbi:nucleotide pyrophosphatase/phosphodiesterase family protein [Solimicrobium silvestre]|uniref:Type I phosphodiesterase / nucleotide pyrophosphatase n=1 Tax=Solimicrobium silvestre TaxID=2099400 RepID=A0A2S9H0C2_9BURK|nr:nucleotide pyrophosphatase/phosphodiesterase family protein [Solimicrobium silvestre]PRC93432.1 Type I phosphodiesterase / nucleotide pyrophosphatase [Solimicrobium silvestre]